MPIGPNSILHVEVATIVTEQLTSSFETARCISSFVAIWRLWEKLDSF